MLLERENRLILLVVIANEGSSPGRKGFKMAVSRNEMLGTIGGGIMEHKLVEYAQHLLTQAPFTPFIKQQIHDKSAPKDQSGMICSGQQTIAFFNIDADFKIVLNSMKTIANPSVFYTNLGIDTQLPEKELIWSYSESLAMPNQVYIIGGGHVGLALSEVLSRLDFEIHILDHRENLNTMEANAFAHQSQTVAFEEIELYIPEGDNIYVVIMSFGYRTDAIIIRRLLNRKFKYLGMMGSTEKMAVLYQNLRTDGYDQNLIDTIHAPIGIDIKSETAQEIAISVAAQLICIKNNR
ncbi:MAG: XdhC family protein [Burkholderiales bacterium]|nr:XdhC family protein [Flavobacterium sp.]